MKRYYTIDCITQDASCTSRYYGAKFNLVEPSTDLVKLIKKCEEFTTNHMEKSYYKPYLSASPRNTNRLITFWENYKNKHGSTCESELTVDEMYLKLTTQRGEGYAGWTLTDSYNDKIYSWIVVPVVKPLENF